MERNHWDLHPERTYIAIAIKRVDGADITNAENFFMSPLIQGLKPWKYNIVTMHGSYMEKIIDVVLYRITECDNIEKFADRKLYLAISDTTFFNENAFLYDEPTGLLSENTVYEGTNVLFPIQLDASKADSKKAKEYLEQLDKEWDSEEKSSKESTTVKKSSKNLRIQQETFVDEENGITFHLPKYDSDYEKWGGQSWSANEEYSNAVFRYRFQVEGEGIDTLTYTLNQGKLGDFPRNEYDDWKVYDNPYTISYEKQENIDDICYSFLCYYGYYIK